MFGVAGVTRHRDAFSNANVLSKIQEKKEEFSRKIDYVISKPDIEPPEDEMVVLTEKSHDDFLLSVFEKEKAK